LFIMTLSAYTLIGAPIGRGGYSTVYRCVDPKGHTYACKLLRKEQNKPDRIHREVRALKQVASSSRVTHLHDRVEDDDATYLIMDWCRGGALQPGWAFSELDTSNIIRQTLHALHDVHAAGVIHCDIKPDNVLLSDLVLDTSVLKLCDFGGAVFYENDGAAIQLPPHSLVGTPWFISPEALRHEITPRTDVWGIGIMAYMLLTNGRKPFNDPEHLMHPRIQSLWRSITTDEPSWRDEDRISTTAMDFVRCCLAKAYQDRPHVHEALDHPWLKGNVQWNASMPPPSPRPGTPRRVLHMHPVEAAR